MKRIEIFPAEGGWKGQNDAIENEMFFKGRASVESATIRLAQDIADAGEHASVEIYIRDGTPARCFTVLSFVQRDADVPMQKAA